MAEVRLRVCGHYPPRLADVESHPSKKTKGRTRCVIVQAEGWATLYNRIGVVKRHVDPREVLTFLFGEGFGVCCCSWCCFAHATTARFQNPAVDVWFHQPSIRSLDFRP